MRKVKVAVVALLNDKSDLLVLWHNKCQEWTFPGGKVNAGELPVDGCLRELHEETRCSSDYTQLHADWESPYVMKGTGETILSRKYLFLGRTDSSAYANVEPEKHREIRWVSLEELKTLAKSETVSDFIKIYLGITKLRRNPALDDIPGNIIA